MAALTAEFGWLPERLKFVVGEVSVETLPDLETKVSDVSDDDGVEG